MTKPNTAVTQSAKRISPICLKVKTIQDGVTEPLSQWGWKHNRPRLVKFRVEAHALGTLASDD